MKSETGNKAWKIIFVVLIIVLLATFVILMATELLSFWVGIVIMAVIVIGAVVLGIFVVFRKKITIPKISELITPSRNEMKKLAYSIFMFEHHIQPCNLHLDTIQAGISNTTISVISCEDYGDQKGWIHYLMIQTHDKEKTSYLIDKGNLSDEEFNKRLQIKIDKLANQPTVQRLRTLRHISPLGESEESISEPVSPEIKKAEEKAKSAMEGFE